ncbi:hypothetical protein [Mesonia hippocampi]|uniref:hypothetical protein n=1 Tax=Mesonia hippocampi TaxID=1628250 RepID=UPI003F991BD5
MKNNITRMLIISTLLAMLGAAVKIMLPNAETLKFFADIVLIFSVIMLGIVLYKIYKKIINN